MPLSDLFAWVESRGKSGVIRVVQADVERKFWVHGRHITGVGSSVEDEHLGRLLVDHGLVDKDAIAQALALQAETQVRLGKILLMLEVIDEQTLAQALTVKIVDAVADALSWPTGSFDFEPGAVATRSFEVEVKIELGECVERAKERALRWRRTRAVIPTVDTRFWLADDHALAKLSGQERELAEAGRDGASAREIAQSLRRSRLPVVEELAELVRAGVLTIDRRPGERAVGDGAPGLEELVASGRGRAASGDLLAALDIASMARSLHPDQPASEALGTELEARVASRLAAELLSRARIPHLRIDARELDTLGLDPGSLAVARSVDGVLDTWTLVERSPLGVVPALIALKRLAERDIIAM